MVQYSLNCVDLGLDQSFAWMACAPSKNVCGKSNVNDLTFI